MNEKTQTIGIDKDIIESFSNYDYIDDSSFQYYDAILAVDLGPYKKGDELDCIAILHDKALVEVYDEASNVIYSQSIKLMLV